ncbi:glycosyltransferase family 1 protein [Bacteroides acidifaciens]|uniref:glycosyltransferase family 4 protein n=1 Tax=Bacteroides acidifaciens TaxID=85831 RepID=UPI003013C622
MEPSKKKVLIDLSNLKHPACGFGQIAINYSKLFATLPVDDLHFVYLLPKRDKKYYGDNVTRVLLKDRKLKRWFPSLTLPKVDIWHSVNQFNCFYRKSPNHILTIHDLNFLFEEEGKEKQKALQIMQKRIDRATIITTISNYVADEIKQYMDLNGKEIRVIYNGVERIDQQQDKRPQFAQKRPFFFTIGEIRAKKNFHLLVDVMKSLPEYDLYICGNDQFDHAEEIRAQIKEKGTTNVYLTGTIEQTEKIWLYRNCEAFLFPSRGEGFGLPVIEAMQFGKAVFISNYTCLPEISNGLAFIWDKLETQAMVESIRKNLPSFYKQKERIVQTKEHAYSFSYERHIKAYIDLYHELLQTKKQN